MSYTHFSRYDRVRLDTLLKANHSYRSIANQIGFSIGAISYEVRINGSKNQYDPYKAHKRYKRLRKKANQCHRKIGRDDWLTKEVIRLLEKHWSPEQIVGRFWEEKKVKPTSATAIYDWCNDDKKLSKLLPRKHSKYRRTKEGNERQRQRDEESKMKSIDQRPRYIEKRKSIGHWEGDTIIGKERTARILTHTERKCGYLLTNMLYDVSADKIRVQTVEVLTSIPKEKRKTITYDRGREFSDWELTEKNLETSIYFAHPYHSWERGTNENTNGLIRRYLPKKTFFSTIKEEELEYITHEINTRPRKRLGYRSPYEVFHGVQLRMLM